MRCSVSEDANQNTLGLSLISNAMALRGLRLPAGSSLLALQNHMVHRARLIRTRSWPRRPPIGNRC